jgi:hypothetical protein
VYVAQVLGTTTSWTTMLNYRTPWVSGDNNNSNKKFDYLRFDDGAAARREGSVIKIISMDGRGSEHSPAEKFGSLGLA